jgi:uncharacterized protein involved in response to NO
MRLVPPMPEPYRLLFPLGVLYALVGVALWPLHAAGWIPYPATLHWTLMIQGFLHSFVLGFLLTAMPAFLHGEKARPWETAIAVISMVAFGVSALAGWTVAAQAAYLVTILLLAQAGIRRFPRRRGDPAEEFLLVALGLAFACAGAVSAIGIGAGWWDDVAPRFTLHLFTKGMMLSIVLGVGSLLVPTFTGIREPLVIPFLAKPGERRPRRALYALMAALLVAAMVLEASGQTTWAARLRLVPAISMLLLVWKIFRAPGRRDLPAWSLWSAGWFVLLGILIAAMFPSRSILGFHFMFLGGFGLLVLGIATRVIVSHGGHGIAMEGRILRWDTVLAIGLALAARVAAELVPHAATVLYGLSGMFWLAGWVLWGVRAAPRLMRSRHPLPGTSQPGDVRPQGVHVARLELPLVRRHP